MILRSLPLITKEVREFIYNWEKDNTNIKPIELEYLNIYEDQYEDFEEMLEDTRSKIKHVESFWIEGGNLYLKISQSVLEETYYTNTGEWELDVQSQQQNWMNSQGVL